LTITSAVNVTPDVSRVTKVLSSTPSLYFILHFLTKSFTWYRSWKKRSGVNRTSGPFNLWWLLPVPLPAPPVIARAFFYHTTFLSGIMKVRSRNTHEVTWAHSNCLLLQTWTQVDLLTNSNRATHSHQWSSFPYCIFWGMIFNLDTSTLL
jgi:hypothetical protein